MNRQAIVGVFVILAIFALFGAFYVLSDFGTRARGYKIGVVFKSATGLRPGGIVYESGVTIGTVDQVILQRDFSVDVIIAVRPEFDIPRNAQFTIQTPLTGDPTLLISLPEVPGAKATSGDEAALVAAAPPLERKVLPLDVQPRGRNPISVSDLLQQGQDEFNRVDSLLASLQKREPKLLDTLQATLQNANELSANGNEQFTKLFNRIDTLTVSLQGSLHDASTNVVDLTRRLDSTAASSQGRVTSLLASLNSTAGSLGETVDSLRSLAKDDRVHGSLITTAQKIADISTTLATITHDLRDVSGNPTTKAQLADTIANIDATTQKANSLLGEFGGRSSVYGVDPDATPPATQPGSTPAGRGGGSRRGPTGSTASPLPAVTPASAANLRNRISSLTKNLIETQIRISGLSSAGTRTNASPLLRRNDNGPQTDFNLIALPRGSQSLLFGANDIGTTSGTTSYNFLLRKTPTPGVQIGAGVLYSRLGALGSWDRGPLGFEGRIYDPRRPTFDAYGHINANDKLQIFGGERDLTHSGRRTVFGVQALF